MSEQIQNMGINPEVSKEMETLTKLIKDSKEIMSPGGGDEVLIKAKGSGVISRLFGGYGKTGGSSKPSTSERLLTSLLWMKQMSKYFRNDLGELVYLRSYARWLEEEKEEKLGMRL